MFAKFLCLLGVLAANADTIELTDANFQDSVMEAGKVSFVKFYAPWCGHCKRMAPDWEKLGQEITDENIVIAKVDCTVQKSVASLMKIRGFPTLYLFAENIMYEYAGPRSYEDLKKFAEGGYKNASTKTLPWNESFVDVVKEQAMEFFQKIGQIMSFDPIILPLTFFCGVAVASFFFICIVGAGGKTQYIEVPAKSETKKDK